jgi:hypothetical protein
MLYLLWFDNPDISPRGAGCADGKTGMVKTTETHFPFT